MPTEISAPLEELVWTPVSSSNVDAVAWAQGADYKLWIRFNNGSVYAYGAPRVLFDDILTTPSKGRFVWQVLRQSSYPYRKVY
jgi:hypothetical protein